MQVRPRFLCGRRHAAGSAPSRELLGMEMTTGEPARCTAGEPYQVHMPVERSPGVEYVPRRTCVAAMASSCLQIWAALLWTDQQVKRPPSVHDHVVPVDAQACTRALNSLILQSHSFSGHVIPDVLDARDKLSITPDGAAASRRRGQSDICPLKKILCRWSITQATPEKTTTARLGLPCPSALPQDGYYPVCVQISR